MTTNTLLKLSDLPRRVAMRAAAPLTLDEATAWARGIGAVTVYWWPATKTAYALSGPPLAITEPEQEPTK